jgi:serum/glucocorticoid-regulated kinase 2
MTAFVSNQHSSLSTPFQCEELEVKSKCRNDFKFLYQVGAGGFGRVWKVQEKKSGQIFAMKEISKAKYSFIYLESY